LGNQEEDESGKQESRRLERGFWVEFGKPGSQEKGTAIRLSSWFHGLKARPHSLRDLRYGPIQSFSCFPIFLIQIDFCFSF